MNAVKFGSIGLFMAIIAHVFAIMLTLSNQVANGGVALVSISDLLIWAMMCFLYYGMGIMAAEKQYDVQRNDLEPLNGVRAAAIGAAIIMCVGNWLVMIIRSVFQDAVGLLVRVESISLLVLIVVTVFFAFLFGNAAGKSVENKYRHVDYENY